MTSTRPTRRRASTSVRRGRTSILALAAMAVLAVIGMVLSADATSPNALTPSPYGGYGVNAGPKAAYYQGHTYFAWINGSNGDVQVAAWDHSAGELEGPYVVRSALDVNLHASPSLMVRAEDGRILVAYSEHNGSEMFLATSRQPNDISSWTEAPLNAQLAGDAYTYPHLIQLEGLPSSPIYLIYRSDPGKHPGHAGQMWQMATSRNGGISWSRGVDFFAGRPSGYLIPSETSERRIDFVASDGAPQAGAFEGISTYHFSFNGSLFSRSGGDTIADDLPFDQSATTLMFDGAVARVGTYPGDVALADDGGIRASFVLISGPRDLEVWWARWDGSEWVPQGISDGNWMLGSENELLPAGHALDPSDPDTIYVSRLVGRSLEIIRVRTHDAGRTWEQEAITQDSDVHQSRPFFPTRAITDLRLLWQFGTVESDTSFRAGTAGLRLEAGRERSDQ